jgi:hypothetical protein
VPEFAFCVFCEVAWQAMRDCRKSTAGRLGRCTTQRAATAQSVEDRLPAVVEARDLVELDEVDVRVTVQFVFGLDAEDIHLSGHVLVLAPVGHVVHQIENPDSQARVR